MKKQLSELVGEITPLPWRVGMRNGENANMIMACNGDDPLRDEPICQVYGVAMHQSVRQCSDDAGMPTALYIAHAANVLPELLEKIEKFVSYWERNYPSNIQCEKVDDFAHGFKAALAKAQEVEAGE